MKCAWPREVKYDIHSRYYSIGTIDVILNNKDLQTGQADPSVQFGFVCYKMLSLPLNENSALSYHRISVSLAPIQNLYYNNAKAE